MYIQLVLAVHEILVKLDDPKTPGGGRTCKYIHIEKMKLSYSSMWGGPK